MKSGSAGGRYDDDMRPLATLLTTVLAGVASGNDPMEPMFLRPIEQGVGDVGPASVSLRLLEPGLQVPSGFHSVYESPIDDRLMRVNGALHALFPRSRYSSSKQGRMIDVPDGTVFSIGPPTRDSMPNPERVTAGETTMPPEWIDLRVGSAPNSAMSVHIDALSGSSLSRRSVPSGASRQPVHDERSAVTPGGSAGMHRMHGPTTIVNDPSYRRVRVQELLHRAASAEQERRLATDQG